MALKFRVEQNKSPIQPITCNILVCIHSISFETLLKHWRGNSEWRFYVQKCVEKKFTQIWWSSRLEIWFDFVFHFQESGCDGVSLLFQSLLFCRKLHSSLYFLFFFWGRFFCDFFFFGILVCFHSWFAIHSIFFLLFWFSLTKFAFLMALNSFSALPTRFLPALCGSDSRVPWLVSPKIVGRWFACLWYSLCSQVFAKKKNKKFKPTEKCFKFNFKQKFNNRYLTHNVR